MLARAVETEHMADPMFERIRKLDPTQFENLAYETLHALGMRNLTWRTPGADGGRDIEGFTTARDLAGFEQTMKWFVECKHYKSSIDWPTVWAKLAYAEVHSADVLLMVTTSNPSPKCESEINTWNQSRKRPTIRFWRGYELANVIRGIPAVGAIFGLIESEAEAEASLLPLATLLSKLCQNAYTRTYFAPEDTLAVEAAAAVSELFASRLAQLREYRKPVKGQRADQGAGYDWLNVTGNVTTWDELSLRAVLAFLRNFFHAESAQLAVDGREATLEFANCRFKSPVGEAIPSLVVVSSWARIEVAPQGEQICRLKEMPYV
jgi:hypothetical protein